MWRQEARARAEGTLVLLANAATGVTQPLPQGPEEPPRSLAWATAGHYLTYLLLHTVTDTPFTPESTFTTAHHGPHCNPPRDPRMAPTKFPEESVG